jgi:hypothetical protein
VDCGPGVANGIDLRMLTGVEAIDLQAGTVAVRNLASSRRYRKSSPASPASSPGTVFDSTVVD